MGKKGILLDLDNTLYNYKICHEYALRACYGFLRGRTKFSYKEFEANYYLARKKIKKQVEGFSAAHSRLLVFQNFFENLDGRTNIALTLTMERIYWRSFFKKMKLYSGVLEFLAECGRRGIKICLVTDLTARVQFEKVRLLRVDKYLDFIVSSEEAGADKPHKKIFSLALKKLGVSPGEALLVGDDYKKDVLGARALGIKTVLVGGE